MDISLHALDKHLQSGSPPRIWLVGGKEPLQRMQACDRVRQHVRQPGQSVHHRIDAGQPVNWDRLLGDCRDTGLFGEGHFFDIRFPDPASSRNSRRRPGAGLPDKKSTQGLLALAEALPDDSWLLIEVPALDWKARKGDWVQKLRAQGAAVVPVEPVPAGRMHEWVDSRARQLGLELDAEATAQVAAFCEGNLMAAEQALYKLDMAGIRQIDGDQLRRLLYDQAQFDVFSLSDAWLQGQAERLLHVLNQLQQQGGIEPMALLGMLRRDIEHLLVLEQARSEGLAPSQASGRLKGSFPRRNQALARALQRLNRHHLYQLVSRCHQADLAIKGQDTTAPWTLLRSIALGLCGVDLLKEAV
jgi:DNA polymerase-3 subunit delta